MRLCNVVQCLSSRASTLHAYNVETKMAPEVGFEPTTNRLTADRSTTELLWIAIRSIERR
jgi:hypothetical protein